MACTIMACVCVHPTSMQALIQQRPRNATVICETAGDAGSGGGGGCVVTEMHGSEAQTAQVLVGGMRRIEV